MKAFLLRRLLGFAATVLAVLVLSFFLMRAVPGGPFSADRRLHPAVEANLEARFHLDWPLWRQFLQYLGPFNLDEHGLLGERSDVLGGLLCGDLGPSFRHRDLSVNDVLAQSLPISLELGLVALAWSVTAGIALGVLSAAFSGGRLDLAVRLASSLGIALPSFAIASLLLLAFAFTWPLFPVAGWGSPAHLVLPSLALGAPFAAYAARLVRAGLLESLSQDWVRTAIGKGLSPRATLLRHALRPALLPVVAWLGPASAGVLTGSLVVEKIFFIPGAGTHFVHGALDRDYTLALGVTLVYTVLVYGLNALADACAALLDPRVALE